MSFLTVKTPHLRGRGDICLYVPDTSLSNLPIYILLHGVYGSAWAWALKGGAHVTAKKLIESGSIKPAILAMPSDGLWGDGSGYLSHHGFNFDQWIVEDVPLAVRENIPGANAKSLLCLAGLSMGGYGALCLGGRFPHHFRAIAAHSAITKLEQMADFVEEPVSGYADEGIHINAIDCLKQSQHPLPTLRFDCGVDDPLIGANRMLHQELNESAISHEYEEFPGGHEWEYWETHITDTLKFFDRACHND